MVLQVLFYNYFHLILASCVMTLSTVASAPQAIPGDPFAPPPPPSFPPSYNTNQNLGFGGFNFQQYNQPSGYSGPPLPPVGPPPATNMADLVQPMPPEAAAAGSISMTSNIPEQEYESGESNSGGGAAASQPYNPPPSFALQSGSPGGPQSLLDAYYTRGAGYYQSNYNNNYRNNDIFGGLFGGTPTGNLFGAFMVNEFIF